MMNKLLFRKKQKILYKDIINDFLKGVYAKDAKVFIDEILMRQGFLTPNVVASKYQDNEAMQQKSFYKN